MVDLRSAVQLFSFLFVGFMLYYHFEVESPVIITWKDVSLSAGSPIPPVLVQPVLPDISTYDTELINLEEQKTVVIPAQAAPAPAPAPVPGTLAERPPVPVGSLQFQVSLPEEARTCSSADILFTPNQELSSSTKIEMLEKLFVDITCSAVVDDTDLTVVKVLPVIPVKDGVFLARFIADDSIDSCEIVARSESGVHLTGEVEKKFIIGELASKDRWCWQCDPYFYRDIPLAYQYLLKTENGDYLFNSPELTINQGESLSLWIVPHPLLIRHYPDSYDKVFFNSWMEAPNHVIQANTVDPIFNKEKGGFRIDLKGADTGSFWLTVTLNWVYPFSELHTDDPLPILASSHLHHDSSVCDLHRSELVESGSTKINVVGPVEYILGNGDKCDCPMKNGRWLNVLAIGAECRAPYCTGDREGSMVGSSTWDGSRLPWLWIPYDCQYHLYGKEDLTYCAQQNDIKWIVVVGDSLPREIIGHLMGIYRIGDTTKFDQADLMLGDSGIRITFLSFADQLLREDGKRNTNLLETIMKHFNLLEEGSSEGIDDPRLKIDLPAEETSPDLFFMNGANAYCLFKDSEEEYVEWLRAFSDIVGNAFKEGRKGDGKKTKMYWYGNPYFHGTAHAGTEHITQARNHRFNDLTKPIVEDMGMSYFDAQHISQGRWEESWDGLHYLRGSQDELWTGQVASTFVQVLFNHVFGNCTSAP